MRIILFREAGFAQRNDIRLPFLAVQRTGRHVAFHNAARRDDAVVADTRIPQNRHVCANPNPAADNDFSRQKFIFPAFVRIPCFFFKIVVMVHNDGIVANLAIRADNNLFHAAYAASGIEKYMSADLQFPVLRADKIQIPAILYPLPQPYHRVFRDFQMRMVKALNPGSPQPTAVSYFPK